MSKPMKVMQVLPALESGGVERGTLEVAAKLVQAGHRSYVVSAGGRLVDELTAAGSTHITLPIGAKRLATLRCIGQMRRLLAELQPDILHLRSRLPAWVAWLAWKQLPAGQRPHLVTTVHGLYSVGRYSGIMTCGERVIAVSDTVRRYIETHYPKVDRKHIYTIYRGVDTQDFPFGYQPDLQWRAAWERDFPAVVDRFTILLPGRITRLKGHEDFINLIALLLTRQLPVYGLIVGEEDPRRRGYAQELRERIRTLGLEDRLGFSGHRSDIKEIFASADLVLSLSSKPESFGRTTLEALRLGTPVIGYDHGGVGEILAQLYPQGAVPFGETARLAARIEQLIRGQLERPQAKPDILTKQAMLEQTLALYRELIEEAHRSNKSRQNSTGC